MKKCFSTTLLTGIVVCFLSCTQPPPPLSDKYTFVFTNIQELRDTCFEGTVIIDGHGCDNLVIDNVCFSSPNTAAKHNGLMLQNVSNVTVRNCDFQNIRGDACQVGNQYKPCCAITIENNEIHEIDGNGINSYYSGGSGNDNCIIRNNHIHHVGKDTSVYANQPTGGFHGIYWKDKGVVIAGNEIHDNYDKGSGVSVRAGARVAQNRIYNVRIGINYTANYPAFNSDLIIENNLIFDTREYGINLSGSASLFNDITAADIRFNTVAANNTTGILIYNFVNLSNPGENNKFRIYGNVVVNENLSGTFIVNNIGGTNAKSFSNTTSADKSALDFADFAAGDYHLHDTSPAINAGGDIALSDIPTIDFDGNQRPVGIADHGAFEMQ